MFERSSNPLDRKVGMLVYCRPDAYVGEVRLELNPTTFHVFEVGLDGDVASPRHPDKGLIRCKGSEVLKYIMCKIGRSTYEAVEAVTESLRTSVSYAGLKDKGAYTCQFVTVRCREGRAFRPEYAFLNHSVRLFFVGKEVTMLSRGDLEGNSFEVVLNQVAHLKRIKEVVSEVLRSKPFPNFYGYQRFGSRRPITHIIGKYLVKGEWEEAVNALLGKPCEEESPRSREARKLFEEGRWREALRIFPKALRIEREVLKALLSGRTYRDALLQVGKKLLRFYVEAYQSYLFNKALSNAIISYEGVEALASSCEVWPIPNPSVKEGDWCSSHVAEVVKEELRDVVAREFLFRGVRETTVTPKAASLSSLTEGNAVLRFFLNPSTYASVILREIFREGLRLS